MSHIEFISALRKKMLYERSRTVVNTIDEWLDKAAIANTAKYQIILPGKNELANFLVKYFNVDITMWLNRCYWIDPEY